MTDVIPERPTFPVRRTCPFDPPRDYALLRAERPICQVRLHTGETAWLVSSHEYVRRILADSRISSDRTMPGFPVPPGIPDRDALRTLISMAPLSLLSMDPPEHTVHRRMVVTEFTVKRIQALRPRIQQITDDRVTEMLRGDRPVDLVQALSLPVPSLVICELLGVPYADRELFQSRTRVLLDRTSTMQQKGTALAELWAYLDDLVTAKEEHPGDDLLSRLVVRYRQAGLLDHRHLVSLAVLLLNAGHETTANMISLSTVALLEHPDRLAELRRDPTLMPQAVEELLRYFSIAGEVGGYRVALADIEIGGVTIRAGEAVIALGSAANRDEQVFADPDTLDVHRNARQHVAFGYGIHQCLGQNLARAELEIVLNTLFARIPRLRLAVPVAALPFKNDASIYGIHAVPVTW